MLMYDNDGMKKLYKSRSRVSLPDGLIILNAKPDPEIGLFDYVEQGPKRPRPGKRLQVTEHNDGYNYTVTRTEVDDPDFDLAGYFEGRKDQACKRIDQQAEQIRLQYITDGAGQAMTYREKLEEAKALQNDAAPDPAGYPLLSAEVGVTGADLQAVADVILAQAVAWRPIAAAIEAARMGAKKAINAATTETEIQAAENAVVWPGE